MQQAIHFICVGDSAMYDLALNLQEQGYLITGSDNEIYELSSSTLEQRGLLPAAMGWFPEKITANLTAVIVGMRVRKDNPELLKAQELGLSIFSHPEYVYELSRQKQRVVITGSHGKTTITSIILHVLNYHKREFDYLVGAQPDGFATMTKLTPNAPIIIIEGDEYASSPIDPQPDFLHYKPHIALISGIAWDHVNIYPTWEEYVDQFEHLAEAMPKAGVLIFDESDDMLDVIGQKERPDITKVPYESHPHTIVDGQTFLITKEKAPVPVRIFGEHNMKNIAGAMTVLDVIGITDEQFYQAIPSFKGAEYRLEKVVQRNNRILFRDFAYAPSKVRATTEAVRNQFPDKRVMAIVELHTFSSLNKKFLSQYKGTLDSANIAGVYIDADVLISQQQSHIRPTDFTNAFGRTDLRVLTSPTEMNEFIKNSHDRTDIFLLMSSSNFDNLDLSKLLD